MRLAAVFNGTLIDFRKRQISGSSEPDPAATNMFYLLESRRDGRANGIVNALQLSADEKHPADAHHRNQSADQAIFDGGCAGSIAKKTSDKLFHFRSP